jgi:radical SAM family uncharacterized protein/radical SAM-linked protein
MKEILPLVSKPVRYLGREIHAIRKDPEHIRLRFCLAFPDVYEVGMSHLGLQILYHILNRMEGVACERAFAPWVDMEKMLRAKDLPLVSLESSTPLDQFDVVGFSLQYELCFTNVLTMLELSRIPFFSKERDERFPLIIAGGPSAFNPAPVADFFDALVIGDGEEVIAEICHLVLEAKEVGGGREEVLKSLSQVAGVYVPSRDLQGKKVRKRIVSDLNRTPYPTCPIVPYMKVIHDRLNLEIARGCKRGCRFCEAGFIHRPYRERSADVIREILEASLKETGYEEFSLLSLSAGDYHAIGPLLSTLMDRYESKKIAASFPSLRIESVVGYLAEQVNRVRKTGFTIAPEAGTERLRAVINKELDEDILFRGVSDLFSRGWKNIKLYFMMGLPTEREEDLRGIVDLSKRLSSLGTHQKIRPNVRVSISTFVPKPHTPFQWESQVPLDEMKEKLGFLRRELKRNHLEAKWQDPHLSYLEAIFSTGDQSLSRVIVEAHRLGCRFDGWSDQFQHARWERAFEHAGRKMDLHTRRRTFEDPLPWDFVDSGVEPAFLREECQRGLRGEVSPPCPVESCRRCGACDGTTVRVREGRYSIAASEVTRKSRIHERRGKRTVRLRFTKTGALRFISHLELVHLFHRAARRAELPLAYSEGFHPMPRIVFAAALPVGVESLAELVDIELEGNLSPSGVKEGLNRTLPQEIAVLEAKEVVLASHSSGLQPHAVYRICFDRLLSQEEAMTRVGKALDADAMFIHQERKGKKRSVDVRPLIERIDIRTSCEDGQSDPPWEMELALRQTGGRTAKPSEIVGVILGLTEESLARCDIVKVE